jgi:hypothetical protein
MSHYYIPSFNRFGSIDDEIFRFAQAYDLKVAMSAKDWPIRLLCMNGYYFDIKIAGEDEIHVTKLDLNKGKHEKPYIANRQTLFALLIKIKDEVK